jgi:hypothetical protein
VLYGNLHEVSSIFDDILNHCSVNEHSHRSLMGYVDIHEAFMFSM